MPKSDGNGAEVSIEGGLSGPCTGGETWLPSYELLGLLANFSLLSQREHYFKNN